jgi:hypothetical protein
MGIERFGVTDEGQLVTKICAWCATVMQLGGRRISHGICDPCLGQVVAQIDASRAAASFGSGRLSA